MKKYLVIDETNTVVNVIVWDGVSAYQPEAGSRLVPYDEVPREVWIGWTYNAETDTYTAPPTVTVPTP